MTLFTLPAGLCALAAAGGATALLAQAPAPTVVRVPGTEVILRSSTPGGGSTTVVSNSGNGVGNRIVVSGTPGLTVVTNARNGIGNRLLLDADDLLLDLDDRTLFPKGAVKPPAVAVSKPAAVEGKPATPVYAGRATAFWTRKAFSDAHDCHLYWSPIDRLWFRYSPDEDQYRPVANPPAAPKDE
jgi:hypothetical protein